MTRHRLRDCTRTETVSILNRMDREPSIYTVAKLSGVSSASVSRVINRRGGVSPETIRRVRAAIDASGFRPRWHAGRPPAIGMLVLQGPGMIESPYGGGLLAGAAERSCADGVALTLLPFVDAEASRADVTALVSDHRLDGVLVMASHQMYRLPGMLAERRIRQVVIGAAEAPAGVPRICSDDPAGGAIAARHLWQLGHRRLAVITAAIEDRGHALRLAGVRAEVARLGGDPGTVTALACPHADHAAGAAAAADLLSRAPAPTAVIATNSMLAIGFADACRRGGIAIPGGMSLVGFEDGRELAGADPGITALAQDARGLGERAARTLLAMIRDDPAEACDPLPLRLEVRASSGIAPA